MAQKFPTFNKGNYFNMERQEFTGMDHNKVGTEKVKSGMGVELFFTREIVERHEGTANLKNT